MPVATCPSREELLDFAVGNLSEASADALAGHLDACSSCQSELAALPEAEDSLIARLRDPLTPDPFLEEPAYARSLALARAAADRPDFRDERQRENGTVLFSGLESDASATNLPRQLGEYQLTAELGRGGMGTVYKARHTKLGRVVALKVLTRARAHDRAAVARFEREMQAVGQLDHRHIVRAYDAREIDGTPILVMEYLEGLDLGEIVRRCGAGVSPALAAGTAAPQEARDIPVPDACELARQAAVGLQTIHEHGQVHRDIKPSNLMLTVEGEVKILDLGLARLRGDGPDFRAGSADEMTATGQGMGTADYMAPEQASDSRGVDIRADIYSLGCTLYKLLTGRAPFSGPAYCTAFDKMTAHVNAAPPPLRDLSPAAPEGLAAVVERMLAKSPANRFATPAEVAEALAPYCAGADLPALLKRAQSSPAPAPGERDSGPPLPPGEGRGEGSTKPSQRPKPAPKPAPQSASGRWKRFAGLLLLLLMVGGLGFALGIMIRVTKDGQTTTAEVPAGSTAKVGPDGSLDVVLPERSVPPRTSASGGRGLRGGSFGGEAANSRLPTVPVTQPVVCSISDYEEYEGRIEKCVVQIPASQEELNFHARTDLATVKEGDLLWEFGDPEFEQAFHDLRLAVMNKDGLSGAQRAAAEARVKSAQESFDRVRRKHPPTKTFAPISGKVEYKWDGSNQSLVSLSIAAPDSMLVTFDVPESVVLAHRRLPDRKPNWELSLPVACALGDDIGFPYRGKVVDVAEGIDPQTHAQRWQAVVPNKDGLFMPGMSVRVRVIMSEPHQVMLIPNNVEVYRRRPEREDSPEEVRIVNDQNVIESREVKFGQQYDGFVSVQQGLDANDWVVVPRGGRGGRGGGGGLRGRFGGGGIGFGLGVGDTVAPEKITTPPPPWASQNVGAAGDASTRKPKSTAPEGSPLVKYRTATVTRGDLTATIGASGTIEPQEVVDISAQVEGMIVDFGLDPRQTDPNYKGKPIDYLSPVETNTYLARIDDTDYKIRHDEAAAELDRAKAEMSAAEVRVAQAKTGAEPLGVPQAALDAARAIVKQKQAALDLARNNLGRTKVLSPVKGVIIDRRINVGQNVGPKSGRLFLIAKDIGKLEIWTSVNESDIGRIKNGMDVHFTVDAVPNEVFHGKVTQIRLNATMTQNVVTYTVVVVIDKPDHRLMPYMTASVNFLIETRRNVLRVPNAALRWRPTPEQIAPEARGFVPPRNDPHRGQVSAITEDGKHVRPVEVERGITDGALTEVSGPDLKEGIEVVTGQFVNGGAEETENPFLPGLFLRNGTSTAGTGGRDAAVNPAADLKALQGLWNVTGVEKGKQAQGELAKILDTGDWMEPEYLYRLDFRRGNPWPGDRDTSLAYFLDPRRIWPSPHNYDRPVLYYRIDPTAASKTMDVLSVANENATGKENLRTLAIYELHGDDLKIAMRRYSSSVMGNQRPRQFTIEPDSDMIVLQLHRYRPAADDKAIQATWEVAEQLDDGKPVSAEELRGRSYLFADFYVKITDQSRGENDRDTYGQWIINSTKTPKTISILRHNYRQPNGEKQDPKPLDFNGIYKLEGDRLTIAYRENKPAPEKFESAPGSGVTLLVLQKVDPNLPEVRVTQPVVREVTDNVEFTGHIEAAQTAEIRAQVTGNLDRVCFKPGMSVKKGDLLFEIDPRLYKAELDQLEAGVMQAKTRLDQKMTQLNRTQELFKNKMISQEDFDQARNQVDDAKAATNSAQAAVQVAQVRLQYTRIAAPFEGKISRSALDAGNLVTADKTVLATLASTDPMYVYFDVDERTVLEFQRKRSGRDAALSMPIDYGLPDEKGYPHRGQMDSADGQIDKATGTARWRAVLQNGDGVLLPGMFVRVRLTKGVPHKFLLVPEGALFSDQGRKFVLVVNKQDVAERRGVKVGMLEDGQRAVTDGLTADDWVITSGLPQVTPGMKVKAEKAGGP